MDRLADWDEMYQAVGSPSDIASDSAHVPMPPELPPENVAFALCLYGNHEERVGLFRFFDEEFPLPDGPMTGDRWRAEKFRGRRHKWDCGSCGRATWWVSLASMRTDTLAMLKRRFG